MTTRLSDPQIKRRKELIAKINNAAREYSEAVQDFELLRGDVSRELDDGWDCMTEATRESEAGESQIEMLERWECEFVGLVTEIDPDEYPVEA